MNELEIEAVKKSDSCEEDDPIDIMEDATDEPMEISEMEDNANSEEEDDEPAARSEEREFELASYDCYVCKNRFGDIGTLKNHMISSHYREEAVKLNKGNLHACQFCPFEKKAKDSESDLLVHVILTHELFASLAPDFENRLRGRKMRKCKICDAAFPDNLELKHHLATEHCREKLIALNYGKTGYCTICNRDFPSLTNLVKHLATPHQLLSNVLPIQYCMWCISCISEPTIHTKSIIDNSQ